MKQQKLKHQQLESTLELCFVNEFWRTKPSQSVSFFSSSKNMIIKKRYNMEDNNKSMYFQK